MRSITVVAADAVIEERLLQLYAEELAVRRVWSNEWREPGVAVLEICAATPSVVVLAGLEVEDAAILAADIDRRDPGIGVLALVADRSPDDVVTILRAGARDVLDLDATDEELRASMGDVLTLVAERQRGLIERGSGPPRRVIVVAGPKGGSGKTTISTNLAAGAAKRYPGHVLLVDLDTQFGDVPSALGLEPEHSIADASAISENERTALKVFLTQHETGLAILAAPQSFAESSDLRDDQIKRTVGALIDEFAMVVIDTSAGVDEASLVAMELASDVIFVATPDVPAIRSVKKQLDALDAIGMYGPRRHLVINRSDARVGLSATEIEETIGLPADFQIPGSRQFPMSTNEGIPMIVGERRDKAMRPLEQMVDFFAPERAEPNGGRITSWFKRKDS
ncbi:MAG: AAA family ATPase [Acidimicrobiales bacterium]